VTTQDPRDNLNAVELSQQLATESGEAHQGELPIERSFEDSLLAHLEWKQYNPELNYLVWHGESKYFPLQDTNDWSKEDNVKPSKGDVACKCGCGQEYLHIDLYNRLTHARVLAGIPFIILSWNRCREHNKKEGGSEDSSHLIGYAVDIAVTSSEARFKILEALLKVGFTRIGIYPWGIHVDTDPSKVGEVCWLVV
jgi:hypothetical protein